MFGWNESGQLAQATNLARPAECFSAVEKLLMACCTMQVLKASFSAGVRHIYAQVIFIFPLNYIFKHIKLHSAKSQLISILLKSHPVFQPKQDEGIPKRFLNQLKMLMHIKVTFEK